jgi:serine/threonine protein kinase
MYCFRCGTLVPDNQRFCGSCGSQVSDPGTKTVAAAVAETPAAATAPMPESPAPRETLLDTLRRELGTDYQVEKELGRGGMAIVFKAVEPELRRPVALKVLPPELAINPAIAERFRREARMAASLDHPNIIPVYRVGGVAGTLYMAMKFVEGRGLDVIMKSQGPLPVPVVVNVLRAMANALAFAHERGIIHRDIKGANILIETDGRVLVSDFGIARATEETTLTATGAVIGTPHFMSPEQCAGLTLGPQCDQYSVGVVAFQMLTGKVPFDAETLPAILQHHFFTPVPDVAAIRADVPPQLSTIVHRLLAKEPEKRYTSTRELIAELDAIPLADGERRKGDLMLRDLARGAGIAKVSAQPFTLQSTVPGTGPNVPAAATNGVGGKGSTRSIPQTASVNASPRSDANRAEPTTPPRRAEHTLLKVVLLLVLLAAAAGALLYYRRVTAPQVQMRRAATLYSAGRREAARQLFAKIASERPRAATPHVYLGRLAREDGDAATAGRELETAVRLEPNNATALREMGAYLMSIGNYDAARRFYVRSLRVEPQNQSAQGYLGCALVRLGRPAEGQRLLTRAGAGIWSACAGEGTAR